MTRFVLLLSKLNHFANRKQFVFLGGHYINRKGREEQSQIIPPFRELFFEIYYWMYSLCFELETKLISLLPNSVYLLI